MRTRAAIAALLALAFQTAPGRADDFPPVAGTLPGISSYQDAITELGWIVHRKAIPSPELAEWMKDHRLNNGGSFSWPPRKFTSFQECLEAFRVFTGLVALDSGDDRALVDFDWHRPEPRATTKDLAAALIRRPPPPSKEDSIEDTYATAWEQGFDALLSAPENFPRVWRLRAEADARLWTLLRHHPNTLYAGVFRDEAGRSHLLFVKNEPMMVNPGEGCAAWHLFDEDGRFERGGLVNTGHRIHDVDAYAGDGKTVLTMEGWFNWRDRMTTTYHLDRNGLIARETRGSDGKPVLNPDGYHCGEVLYTTPQGG